jgi:FkbM family methyltransferase
MRQPNRTRKVKRSIRLVVETIPVLFRTYLWARRNYHFFRRRQAAKRYFVNYAEYRKASCKRSEGTVEIQTIDGMKVTVRNNMHDAYILAEIFLDKPYMRNINIRSQSTVVDIGGYIGDFSLYAAKCLKARKVVVYEPSPKNFAILQRNIENNNFHDRIVAINMAVSDAEELVMDTDEERDSPAMVSLSESSQGSHLLRIPSVTLAELIRVHGTGTIDLLKLDCEGAEYPILLSAPLEALEKIENIVFEYHEIENFEAKLEAVQDKLKAAGYQLKTEPPYVYATRE